jgi:hypothetical protein
MLQKNKGYSAMRWGSAASVLALVLGSSMITAQELAADSVALDPKGQIIFLDPELKSVSERIGTTRLTSTDVEHLSEQQLQVLVLSVLKQHPELDADRLYDLNGENEGARMVPYLAKLPAVQAHNLKLLYRYIDYHTINQLRFGR